MALLGFNKLDAIFYRIASSFGRSLGKSLSVISVSLEPAATSVLQHFFVKIPHFFEFSLLGYWDYGLEVGFSPLTLGVFWLELVLYNPPRPTHDLILVPGVSAAWSAFRLYFCFLCYHSYGVCGDSGKGIYKSITTRREATRV